MLFMDFGLFESGRFTQVLLYWQSKGKRYFFLHKYTMFVAFFFFNFNLYK